MDFDDLLKLPESDLERLASSMLASTQIRRKSRKGIIQTGKAFQDKRAFRGKREFRVILDASTRHVVFLEHNAWIPEIEVPKISPSLVNIIVCWRQRGGLHFVMDLELENDWVIRSVTDSTFSNWLARAEEVSQ